MTDAPKAPLREDVTQDRARIMRGHDLDCPCLEGGNDPCNCGFDVAARRIGSARRLASARPDAGKMEEGEEDKIADMIAFGASEAAPYLYPGADQQSARAAYCEGAEQGARALLSWQEERTPAQVAAGDGYATAFYEIAKMLDIGAQAKSPADVWRGEMRPKLEALTAGLDAGDEVERVAFTGHDRMDRPTMDDVWRKVGWGHDVVANRTTVMRFIRTIDALEAELAAMREGVGWGMQHVAYFGEGEFHWMSGIRPRDCELYAARKAPAQPGSIMAGGEG